MKRTTVVTPPIRRCAGRENPLVAAYFLDDHPTFLQLIELVIREARDMPVSLCGELAGRIEVIPRLLRAGLRSLIHASGNFASFLFRGL